MKEGEILRQEWRNPDHGRVVLGPYLATWIDQRPNLRPRTVDLYRWLAGRYIDPIVGAAVLDDISPATVRAWRAKLLDEGTSNTMIAKSYRLLRAVLNTAVEDELI
jgi:hypothetical protein